MSMTAAARVSEGMRGLKGKNVLVTGGTSGIGQAIAVRFAEYGANLAINYLTTSDEATETGDKVHACLKQVQQQGVRDVLVQGDVSKEDDVVRMFEDAVDQLGGIDVLINNAGFQTRCPCTRYRLKDLLLGDRDEPARGLHLRARGGQAVPGRLRSPGVIINISSVHQLIPKPNYIGYSAKQGRHAEPDPHLRVGVCLPRAFASTRSAQGQRSRRLIALELMIPRSARGCRAAHPAGARGHIRGDGRR